MEQAKRRPVERDFPLQARPGFLIRRLHQIHTALFFEECQDFDVTPVQFSVLSALKECGALDQASLAREIGIDRTNVADVVRRLAARGLVSRTPDRRDLRLRLAKLTDPGARLLASMEEAARRAHERTIAPLNEVERAQFVKVLGRLVDANNAIGRAPLRYMETGKG